MNLKHVVVRMAASILAAILLLFTPVMAVPSVSAKSVVLMDGENGRVLWSKNADDKSLIASTTKIMTGILIAESCSLQDYVDVPKEAVGIEGSSIYLRENERISVEALLYGMMLHSGNDAAAALAIYHSGSVSAFTDAMNAKAKELGLCRTKFENPHGLDGDQQYSTAYELAVLTKYAMSNELFRKVVSTKIISFGDRTFTNHNKLLWRYDGVIGVKTGYTKQAGRILVSFAQRDGESFICVTISAPDDWKDHQKLLDYGFSSYDRKEILQAGQVMAQVPVLSGGEEIVHAAIQKPYACLISDQEAVSFRLDLPEFVFAPVLAGDSAGTVSVYADETLIVVLPLIWRYSVLESD